MKNYDNYFLPVDNMEEAKRYYEEILGLKKKFDFSDKGMVAYNIGNEEPAIILKDKNKTNKEKASEILNVLISYPLASVMADVEKETNQTTSNTYLINEFIDDNFRELKNELAPTEIDPDDGLQHFRDRFADRVAD